MAIKFYGNVMNKKTNFFNSIYDIDSSYGLIAQI